MMSKSKMKKRQMKKMMKKMQSEGVVVEGQLGKPKMFDVNELISGAYQRPITPSQVNRFVKDWHEALLGVILVSRRQNDQLAVMDGWHRTTAAKKKGVKRLRGLEFTNLTLKQEAHIYRVKENINRPLSSLNKHKAALVEGENIALTMESIVLSAGMQIAGGDGDNNIKSINTLRRILTGTILAAYSSDPDLNLTTEGMLKDGLQFIRDAWDGHYLACQGWFIEGLIRFICEIEVHNKRYGYDITTNEAVKKLKLEPTEYYVQRAKGRRISYGEHMETSAANVFIQQYNRGRKPANRMKMTGKYADE